MPALRSLCLLRLLSLLYLGACVVCCFRKNDRRPVWAGLRQMARNFVCYLGQTSGSRAGSMARKFENRTRPEQDRRPRYQVMLPSRGKQWRGSGPRSPLLSQTNGISEYRGRSPSAVLNIRAIHLHPEPLVWQASRRHSWPPDGEMATSPYCLHFA